jgi:hypothetical protein
MEGSVSVVTESECAVEIYLSETERWSGHGGVWWPPYPINAENGRNLKGTCFATSEIGNTVAVALGQERLS